jgi:hypothetical protein
MTIRRVAVVGAGIMGSSTAIFLARRGVQVVLYDAAPAPFSGASRWNEGKIHLGFLYAGDPSFRTARRVLPGGLAFRPLLEELLSRELSNFTGTEDICLVHRDSVVSSDGARAYFNGLAALIRSAPGARQYLADLSDARVSELSQAQLERIADPQFVVAGFGVPERSVSTQWVGDRFVEALAAEPRIELRTSTRVLGVMASEGAASDSFRITTETETHSDFDAVVNASWEGRLRIDATMSMPQPHPWSHRYRLALFIETVEPTEAPSAVLCTGPFGDVKNYNGREHYVSWYPTGMIASGEAIDPPRLPQLSQVERDLIAGDMFQQLGRIIPGVREIQARAREVRVEGGWVFASGQGVLSDPRSTLHQRDRIGIQRMGNYFSVDTGKYSVGPWLAQRVVDALLDDGG